MLYCCVYFLSLHSCCNFSQDFTDILPWWDCNLDITSVCRFIVMLKHKDVIIIYVDTSLGVLNNQLQGLCIFCSGCMEWKLFNDEERQGTLHLKYSRLYRLIVWWFNRNHQDLYLFSHLKISYTFPIQHIHSALSNTSIFVKIKYVRYTNVHISSVSHVAQFYIIAIFPASPILTTLSTYA